MNIVSRFKCLQATSFPISVLNTVLHLPKFYSAAVSEWRTRPGTLSSDDRDIVNEFTTYCYHRDLSKAMVALDSMQKRKLWADSVTYSELIKCCIAHRAVEQGKQVHRHVFSNGYEPKTFLINSLLNMYVKFNMLNKAQFLFDRMPERNVVSWTTMIAVYSNSEHKYKALQMLIMMLRDGVRPNMYTFSSVLRASEAISTLKQLHSCIIKVGLELDVFVRSALIDIYCRWGEPGAALSIFNEMVTSDLVVWNSIIGGFAQNNAGEEALDLFIRMKRSGLRANQLTLTSVLRGCTSLALLELGRQVHVHVTKFSRDLVLENALLDMYCKCGSLKDADSIFTDMAVKDVISWSTMIIGFAQNGFSRKAIDLFEAMKDSRIKPNYITVLGVLFACSHAGLVNDGQYYFESMKTNFGVDPGREHYGCMIDLLGRAGKLDEAMKLIQEMKCEPDVVTWRTLLGACRVHRNMDLAEYVAKKVLSLDPDDAGTYTLLSNIYAKSQRFEDVEKMRSLMKDRRIKKEPGCSWIEINKQVHTFILGDKAHPEINAIHQELSHIISRLKGEGYVPDTNFVYQDLEGEQMENSLVYHSEKVAIVFGIMRLPKEKSVRIRKNLRICGDCHVFAKLLAKMENRSIIIRDPVRYHHFQDGACSCGDYW